MKGLEPPRPETLDPKSNAATNYATCAYGYVIHQMELDVYLTAKLDISILFSKLKLSDHTIFFYNTLKHNLKKLIVISLQCQP